MVACAFAHERRWHLYWSPGLPCPFLWYLVVCTRPIGAWLNVFGLGSLASAGDAADGSLIDRVFYLSLTAIGIGILAKRKIAWGTIRHLNTWIVLLLLYALLSVAWSQYPYISLKRVVKVAGTFVMALVVMSEEHPLEAMLSVVRRCAYIHFPMSLLTVKWYRDIGLTWDWEGTMESWKGIAASKNVLGQVVMMGTMVLIFDLIRHRRERRAAWINVLFIGMGLYLLRGSPHTVSVTSVTVFAFGLFVLLALRSLARSPARARFLAGSFAAGILALGAIVVVHSVVMFSAQSALGKIITTFGRDITLTERTLIWHDIYQVAARSPVVGVGCGGFWIGREANIPWNANMTWVLAEGHNGYVDTYLQLGWIGVCLVVGGIVAAIRSAFRVMAADYALACFQLTVLLIVILVNITETSFLRGDHNLWFAYMFAITRLPIPASQRLGEAPSDAATETVAATAVFEADSRPND